MQPQLQAKAPVDGLPFMTPLMQWLTVDSSRISPVKRIAKLTEN
ncbi:hypothetical protein QBE55_01505 [Eubacteriales bacterium mix99]